MDSPPIASLSSLASILMRDRHAAWCVLDRSGTVSVQGGDWQRFGQQNPVVGRLCTDSFAALVGLLPLTETLFLHSIELAGPCVADLHVVPEPNGYFVCLLDCTDRTEQQRRIQQQGNELALLHSDLARQMLEQGRVGLGPSLDDTAIFESDAQGRFWLLSPKHDWLIPFVDQAADASACSLAAFDPTSFLGNFLLEAHDFWNGTAPGSLASGSWSEVADTGEEVNFEAMALLDASGARGLVLKLLLEQSTPGDNLLQGLRESSLTLQAFQTEAQKKEVLLQCIVHDLRGPLSSMSAVLSLLGKADIDQDKRDQLLEVAQRQALRQDELMREVLTVFAKEVRGLQKVERSPERAPDLALALKGTIADRLPAFELAGLGLELELDGAEVLKVPGHDIRLSRVIGNLLDNARRFSPPGGHVLVQVQICKDPRMVEVQVLDRGPGVSKPDQARLFQRFSRLECGAEPDSTAGHSGSVGLGLFYCRTSVEAWGGQVGYRARPGGGSIFWFRLPLLVAR